MSQPMVNIPIDMDKILMCWEIAYRGASQVERLWLDQYRDELRKAIQSAAQPFAASSVDEERKNGNHVKEPS